MLLKSQTVLQSCDRLLKLSSGEGVVAVLVIMGRNKKIKKYSNAFGSLSSLRRFEGCVCV
jgi:hypothetical protein